MFELKLDKRLAATKEFIELYKIMETVPYITNERQIADLRQIVSNDNDN